MAAPGKAKEGALQLRAKPHPLSTDLTGRAPDLQTNRWMDRPNRQVCAHTLLRPCLPPAVL